MRQRNPFRKPTRTNLRRPFRHSLRGCLRGRSGPSDFTQMLTAYGRAVRAHRHLARLAPSFFDAAVVDRERENRLEQLKWMAVWEPYLAKAYGVAPEPPDLAADLPRLPHPKTQRAVERRLAEVQFWLEAGAVARQRHHQRRPYALPTVSQLARLLSQAFDLKNLALGLNSPNPLPEKIGYDYELTDLKRGYGHLCEPAPAAAAASGAPPDSDPGVLPVVSPAVNLGSLEPVDLPPPAPAPPPRCDAWSRLARQRRCIGG